MAKKKEELITQRSSPRYPKDYLFSVADKIHKTVPTMRIIYNTLKEIWGDGADYGYQRRIEDSKVFKNKREQRLKSSWDMVSTNVDNSIHNKRTP